MGILKQRLIKIDGKTRTDPKFPTGFMDVVQVEKTGENFRVIYDVKGRFTVHRITPQEAKYRLCKVREVKTGPNAVPYLHTFATRIGYVFIIGKGNKPYI